MPISRRQKKHHLHVTWETATEIFQVVVFGMSSSVMSSSVMSSSVMSSSVMSSSVMSSSVMSSSVMLQL